ncbi:Mu transposase, C-terminal [Aromatoleum tolulyticum]|uniref:Mu transposase, C-terminal n=1 Tax=Aromatoleum tolulyticum TaxID=34027 RepID=A0A1N6N798_9RHOO|nr:Mu transposase C-terminal domain-containing protein [Aromatoleum tolulyticum]SIP87892.1 Mu transposase, C-terminal [Aromatoleum tolulyticum]
MFKNQVYEHVESGQRIRILDLEQPTQTVWTFNLGEPKALPRAYAADDLRTAIADAGFTLVTGEPSKNLLKRSAAAIQRRDAAYACIEPLVRTTEIFDPAKRSALVKARAEELNCSQQTIYKYLRTWWREGQSKNALLPNFHRIGSIGGVTGNRGRPPIYLDRPIYQMTETDHTAVEVVLKRYYLKSDHQAGNQKGGDETATLDATFQRLLENSFSYADSEGVRHILPYGERPSEAQFRRAAGKFLPKELTIRARKGDSAFELTHRAKLGSLRHQTYTVGDVYEIDSTVADVFLVHPDDRSKIVGKPAIYLIRDRKSGLCVGWYVGLESASWLAAMHAIKSITEDKAEVCKRYGLPYSPSDWPAHGAFPKEFAADRGPEMVSKASAQLADGLESTILNLPKGRGDWKPHVECGFKQTQRSMADSTPGYVPPETFGKRQVRDYSQGAALTLEEFTREFLAALIRTNRTPMAGYNLTPNYVLDGMQPTPINIWNAEIRDRAGLLSHHSEEEVRFALLPRAEATVTREGIRLGDCFYTANQAVREGWFVAAGNGSFHVTVSFDRRLVDSIYVHDRHDPERYFVAHLLDKCSHYRGRSAAEVESLKFLREVLRQEGRHTKRQLQSDFHAIVDPMVKEAVSRTKVAAKGKSRSARKGDTVAARADVLTRQRQSEARIGPDPGPDEESAAVIPLPRATSPEPARPVPEAQPQPATKSRQQRYQELMDGN